MGIDIIFWYSLTEGIHHTHIVLGGDIPLFGKRSEPTQRTCEVPYFQIVFRNMKLTERN
jgi:hypothetical protein